MLKTMLSEWTKLRTTKSFYWTTGLAFVLAVVFVALAAAFDSPDFPLYGGALVVQQVLIYGLIPMLIQAAMVVTTEYRFNVNSINFAITPQRWQLALSKLAVYGLIAVVLSIIILVASYTAGDHFAPYPVEWTTNVFARRSFWAVPLVVFLLVMMTQGLGWILRSTAAVVMIMITLPIFEFVIGFIPKIGQKVQFIAPFQNAIPFVLNSQSDKPNPFGGDPLTLWGSFGVFAVWVLVIYAIGLLLLERRDA
ncbi:ABC transporter permease [Corynebacterium sp. 20_84]